MKKKDEVCNFLEDFLANDLSQKADFFGQRFKLEIMSTDPSEKASYDSLALALNKSLATMGFSSSRSRLSTDSVRLAFDREKETMRSRPTNLDHRDIDTLTERGT